MAAPIAHFAINADDVEVARRFYSTVLGWSFEAWGPPGFFRVDTGGQRSEVIGALQQRRDLAGTKVVGYEATFAVDDVDAVVESARANGGKVLMEKTTITGVGDLVFIADPSGNPFGAMRYDESAT